ncbi:MAG: precorrin-6A synthase (deacetylating) [Rhizobiaceae bacterium]|nr:precorrin-6A synthase (deacetylating) [Rhizobiaceae bacterium]
MTGARRQVLVIGIGAGNPRHVTLEAVEAIHRLDVVFIPDKGEEKRELATLRHDILRAHADNGRLRVVTYAVPKRRAEGDYGGAVDDWHATIAGIHERLLMDEAGEGDVAGFLVWGDPSLYDSTLRILERVAARGRVAPQVEVIAGITAVQALTAAHQTTLNEIGRPVTITTGRRLAEDIGKADSTVVMLDGAKAFRDADPDLDIFWGAYLGTPDEILISGRLGDVSDEIVRVREEARARHGWIMDTYLLKRRGKE